MLLGSLDLTKRSYDQAISEGQRAVTLAPNSSDGYFLAGEDSDLFGETNGGPVAADKGMRLKLDIRSIA
jgi:hypothetical protein